MTYHSLCSSQLLEFIECVYNILGTLMNTPLFPMPSQLAHPLSTKDKTILRYPCTITIIRKWYGRSVLLTHLNHNNGYIVLVCKEQLKVTEINILSQGSIFITNNGHHYLHFGKAMHCHFTKILARGDIHNDYP